MRSGTCRMQWQSCTEKHMPMQMQVGASLCTETTTNTHAPACAVFRALENHGRNGKDLEALHH